MATAKVNSILPGINKVHPRNKARSVIKSCICSITNLLSLGNCFSYFLVLLSRGDRSCLRANHGLKPASTKTEAQPSLEKLAQKGEAPHHRRARRAYRCQHSIEMKIQGCFVPRLAIGRPRELLAVAEQEFDLIAPLIHFDDVHGGTLQISGRQDGVKAFARRRPRTRPLR